MSEAEVAAKIAYIYKHTIYTEEQAAAKLAEFGGDAERVVKDYMGIPAKPVAAAPKKSLNQTIYRQFREKLAIADSFTATSGRDAVRVGANASDDVLRGGG